MKRLAILFLICVVFLIQTCTSQSKDLEVTSSVEQGLGDLCRRVDCRSSEFCRVVVAEPSGEPQAKCVTSEQVDEDEVDRECQAADYEYAVLNTPSYSALSCSAGQGQNGGCPTGSVCSGVSSEEDGVCCFGKPKPGYCPLLRDQAKGSCSGRPACRQDSDCVGESKCCSSNCEEKTCREPTCKDCNNGQVCVKNTEIPCITGPCMSFECRDRDRCGGCLDGQLCVNEPFVRCEICGLRCGPNQKCVFALDESLRNARFNKPTQACVSNDLDLNCNNGCRPGTECVLLKAERRKSTKYETKCIKPRNW